MSRCTVRPNGGGQLLLDDVPLLRADNLGGRATQALPSLVDRRFADAKVGLPPPASGLRSAHGGGFRDGARHMLS